MKKIMIVDDDADVARLLKTKLEATGRFSTVVAIGGRAGVEMAQTERPDLIVCDVDMPDMGGGQVAQAIAAKEETKHIPLIFLTGLYSAEEAAKIGKTGVMQIVSKQSPLAELIKKIDEVSPAT